MNRTKEELELHREIYNRALQKRNVSLTDEQKVKFEQACWKNIDENDSLSLGEYLIAANVYLGFILDFPQLSL